MTDDELLEELRRLVTSPNREPPVESIVALSAEVARKFATPVNRPWWRKKLTVGAAVFAVVAGSPAVAFALDGASLPDPLRSALYAIGLPVDSVPVADTKAAEGDLEHALRNRNQARINQAADHLKVCLAELDPADRLRMAPRADALLDVAAESEGGDGDHSQSGPSQPVSGGTGGPGSGGDSTSGAAGSSSTEGGTGGTDTSAGSDGGSGGSTLPAPTTTVPGGTATQTSGGGSDGDQTTTTTTTTVPAQTQTDGGGGTSNSATSQSAGSSDGSPQPSGGGTS